MLRNILITDQLIDNFTSDLVSTEDLMNCFLLQEVGEEVTMTER